MTLDIASLGPGDLVAERYRLEAEIGRGGFGIVFRATQLPIQRAVALKVIQPRVASQARATQRFYREAEIARRLSHPNTVSLLDFGQTDDGIPFIAWELLQGCSLQDALAADGPFSPERVQRVALQVCRSLMEAHALGFVHRDIKPANIFLCDFAGERDFVKVLDFGVATVFDPDRHSLQRLTTQGQVLGTPHYTAPEMILNKPLSPAVDVYALGLVMAELLCGHPIVSAERKMDVYFKHIADEPVPLPPAVLASPWGALIQRATQKDPAARFPDAQQLYAALQNAPAITPQPFDPRMTVSTVFDLDAAAIRALGTPPAGTLNPAALQPAAPPPDPPEPESPPPPAPHPTVLLASSPPAVLTSPPPAAAPRRSLGWLMILAVALVAAAVGCGVAALLSAGSLRELIAAATSAPAAEAPDAAEPAPSRRRRSSSAPDKLVAARLKRAGYEIIANSHNESGKMTTWTWSVQDNGPKGGFNTVLLLAFASDDYAQRVATSLEDPPPKPTANLVARDGRFLYMVSRDGTPKGEERARRLLRIVQRGR